MWNVQARCMTWLFAYVDVCWVAHGGPRSQVPCSGRDAMEVRRGQGHMPASLRQTALRHCQCEFRSAEPAAAAGILPCVLTVV